MTAPTLFAGASGYSFKEWKGNFYPDKMKPEDMLTWYSERLPTVEINNTFYQMPKAAVLENWAKSTPDNFRFSIKASRRITHMSRLRAETAADSVKFLYDTLAALGPKRGPVLFQLPPFMQKDLPRLSEFLHLLPDGHRAAFEFRNDTWFDDDVYELLKEAGASLCVSEREDSQASESHAEKGETGNPAPVSRTPPPLIETSSWGYVRLRLEAYSEDDLRQWAARLQSTTWRETYVYFMHEPTAPAYAQTLMNFMPA